MVQILIQFFCTNHFHMIDKKSFRDLHTHTRIENTLQQFLSLVRDSLSIPPIPNTRLPDFSEWFVG